MRSLLAVAAFSAAVLSQNPVAPAALIAPRHLVLIRTTGPAQLQQLQAQDIDLAGCQTPLPAQRLVEAIVDDREIAVLLGRGFRVQVLQRDLSAHYAAQAALHATGFPASGPDVPNPPLGQGAMGGHWTLAQMEAIVDALRVQNPAICAQKVSIGNTIENRSIWMIKISDNVAVDENEPEVLFDALHHAREPLSMEATIVFMDWLVSNYGTDPDATFIVDERELYFVPCLNPDGYEYNRTTNPGGGGLWRKNRKNNGNGTFGVDLNRNYATAWNAPNGGSSATTSSETYRGTGPFSEPETTAIEAFSASRQFVTIFTTHTYTDVLLRPWGWQVGSPANAADYNTLGAWLVQENLVNHGSISQLLYIASGNSVDHHHTVRNSIAFTAELGRSNEGGFWPSGVAITNIATRHQPMFRKVALSAGGLFTIDATVVTEGAGANGNGTVEAGELGNVVITVRNGGLTATSASVALQSLTAGVTVVNGAVAVGSVPRLGTATHAGTPLVFAVAPGLPSPTAQLRVLLTGDGRTIEQIVNLNLIVQRLVLRDDFEQDRGFRRAPVGTATTGLWERAVPQATVNAAVTIQPGTQTTPGGTRCQVTAGLAGASATTNDVDGGYTDLETPEMDLTHLVSAEARLQYWYAESASNDPMAIEISRNGGGSWTPAFSRSTSTGAWTALTLDLGTPLTAQMKLRVRAQDTVDSLVECLIDDFEVRGLLADGSITLLSSGAPGTLLQVAISAPTGSLCIPLMAFATGPPTSFAGVGGQLLIQQATTIAFPLGFADAGGRSASELLLPAGFPGLTLHWQAAVFGPGGASFGPNRTSVVLQ